MTTHSAHFYRFEIQDARRTFEADSPEEALDLACQPPDAEVFHLDFACETPRPTLTGSRFEIGLAAH